jgi:hypothetical protein
MAGDTTNAALWTGADVYIHDTPGTAGPTDVIEAWGTGWKPVGLLDGEEGFTIERDEDVEEHYAWGGVLVKQSRGKHKRTIKFVCLEDNAETFGLVNPGSERTETDGEVTSTIKVPSSREFAIGFEVRDGNSVKRRIASRASVAEVGEIKEAEAELMMFEITVVILPEADGTLYTELWNKDTTATP